MKNVALMIYSLKGGGAERVVSLLSQELGKTYNLYLIVFDSEDMVFEYSGKLIDINVRSYNNFFIKLLNVFKRAYKVRKIKKLYDIDTSISFLGSANIVNVLSKSNRKTIVSIHSNRATRKRIIWGNLSKVIYNKSDKVVGVSKGVSNNMKNNYKLNNEKVKHIYNPIDFKEIQNLSIEEVCFNNRLNENDFIITTMGRLTNAKGQWHLIRSLSKVKKEIVNIKLVILGKGELEGYLKELVENLGLSSNVIFLGYKKNPFKYIKRSNLFVLSSLYEGFGNVIIEAMACGTPVISTDCESGPREILAPKTDINYKTNTIEYSEYGVLVPVCDGVHYNYNITLTREEKLLAKSIINLYNDETLSNNYSEKSKNRSNDFDINNITDEWKKLINENVN